MFINNIFFGISIEMNTVYRSGDMFPPKQGEREKMHKQKHWSDARLLSHRKNFTARVEFLPQGF